MANISENHEVAGYSVIGVTLAFMQGDTKVSKVYYNVNLADIDEIVDAVEATNQFTFVGMSPIYRKESFLDKTLDIAQGTESKLFWGKVGVKRTAEVAGEVIDLKTLYLDLPLARDSSNEALKAALVGKTIKGGLVTDIIQSSSSSLA